MGKQALVTGSATREAEVCQALEDVGFTVTRIKQDEDAAARGAQVPAGSIDCYVQLPVDISAGGDTALQRVHDFLEQGLMARFATALAVLPTLAPESTVVLVSGNVLVDNSGNDDQRARLALLRVLAHCVIADAGPTTWVTVVDHRRSAEEIATISLERGNARMRMIAEFAERNADLSYDDWKLALLDLASNEA